MVLSFSITKRCGFDRIPWLSDRSHGIPVLPRHSGSRLDDRHFLAVGGKQIRHFTADDVAADDDDTMSGRFGSAQDIQKQTTKELLGESVRELAAQPNG